MKTKKIANNYSGKLFMKRKFLYICINKKIMPKAIKIYKPTDEEIFQGVIKSFELENIRFSLEEAKEAFKKALARIKKVKK
ncbi:MAG: hypothetical protein WC868_11060 [Bacteroidales bacterium]